MAGAVGAHRVRPWPGPLRGEPSRPPAPRRRSLGAAQLAVALAAAAVAAGVLMPSKAMAQTPSPDPDLDLLQPTLDGNPANPPRFRASATAANQPATGTFTAPAPNSIGVMPVYGSPTGFGAGDTGFNSSNAPRRKRPPQRTQQPPMGASIAPPDTTFAPVPEPPPQPSSQVPVLPAPPPPAIYPKRAASRPGAALPDPAQPLPVSNPPPEVHPLVAANRPGAVLAGPPPLDVEASASTPPPGTPPLNTLPLGTPSPALPIAASDAYEAIGIKAGSFLILPAIELSPGFDSNPQHTTGGGSSGYFVVAPELHVRSLWSSSSLTADITGSYYDYGTSFTPSLNRPYVNSKIDGVFDVSRSTQIEAEQRVIVATDNPGSPNITAGLASLPINITAGGTLGVIETFNRLSVSLKTTYDRSMYQDSTLTDGETASNADRNFDQYGGIMRTTYEIDPGMKPFVEVSADARVHDLQFDSNGLERDSNGYSVKVGADVNLFGSLTGEMAVGYLERIYEDPTLPNISGVTLDGALIWQATALTTAKLTAASSVGETIVPGVSGSLSRDVNLEVDHALRRWLIATGTIGYGTDDYVGDSRVDKRYFVSGGITYKLNPMIQLKGVVRHDWLSSNAIGANYDATSVLLTLRLQR